ncbi:MAG TPA: T9SS type A sorting domain-containing protein [Flavisolibacter sp.]|nr:T9SS type A sorting domain-containing protein [Flavisolibacter sp.]
MKRIFTLLILFSASLQLQAQAILNEVYAIPGSARQEFFEFYNSSTTPVSMDNYTIVTYFEAGGDKGFYVLDLPALTLAPLGFFVGSSSVPFNYQGVSNSTSSQYSWNDLTFMANNNAYLKKWIISNNVSAAIDGNASYDLAPVPANFNDFFNKIGGSGATYNVFVFKNGILQNVFLGGTGGATFLPTYIVSLPSLYVDMSSTAPDFTINFSTYANVHPEYVIQDVGSDNGYIRLKDGYCGTWTKSSAQVNHSPGVTNGGASEIILPDISVAAAIVRGTAPGGSTVNFDAVAGPVTDFPVTMNVFVDNGSVPGELDATDTYLVSKTENTVADGPFTSVFFPYDANIIIQTITSAGCIDNVRFIPNVNVLPVRLISFEGNKDQDRNRLRWTVGDNESGQQFQVERSMDANNFAAIAIVKASDKKGMESYSFSEGAVASKIYYRLKLVDRSGKAIYSNIVSIENNNPDKGMIRLTQNPVDSYISFQYHSATSGMSTVNIYNVAGSRLLSEKTNLVAGNNTITIALDGKLYTGAYILELSNQMKNDRVKFIKR